MTALVLPEALGLAIALALVLLNGFFVAAEFALVKVRATRLEELSMHGNATARQARVLTGRLDAYLAATQLGITIASLGLGWIGEPAVAAVLEPPLHSVFGLSAEAVEVIAFAVGFSVITLFHITLGELAPKSIAILRPEATTLVVTWPLYLFSTVMRPVIAVLNGTANLVLRAIGLRAASEHEVAHSEEELRLLLASSRDQGVLDPVEQELAARSLALGDLAVRDVMVPRTALAALDVAAPLEAARALALDRRHSRLPVYRESPDDMVGYVEWFDLYAEDAAAWADRVRPLPALPESMSVSAALARLREAGEEAALVVDEYGGTAGVLFADDILAEVASRQAPDPTVGIAGSTPLHQVAELKAADLGDEESVSVAGYVNERLGRIGRPGDRVAVGAWEIVVLRASTQRVEAVRLDRRPDAVATAPDADPR